MTAKSSEGQPNPDAAIVEAALERHPLSEHAGCAVWEYTHLKGLTATQLAWAYLEGYPAFAQALREGIAARRGQRFGGHGGG